jgi:DNA-binding NarL/FixJ family response regulator
LATLTPPDTAALERGSRVTVGLLADEMTRRRLELLLEPAWFSVRAATGTIEQLLDSGLSELDVAILVGGSDLADRGGPLQRLASQRSRCAILVVGPGEDRGAVRRALRAGADGYVAEHAVEQQLNTALTAVVSGQLCVPQCARRAIAPPAFSFREKQVLELVANGLTNGEIANRLYLSESTVKCHLSSSFRKLGVSSRAEAAADVLDAENGIDVGVSPSLERQLLGV